MSDLLVKGVGLLAGIGYVGLVAMMLWAMFAVEKLNPFSRQKKIRKSKKSDQ